MSETITKVEYSNLYCQNTRIYPGLTLYNYVYGKMTVVEIKRVKTKFEQFNYVILKVDDINTVCNKYKQFLKQDLLVTFREDYIDEFLFVNKDDVVIKNEIIVNYIFKENKND